MKKNMQEKVTRWSIRRLSVGVASVVVASGFFIMSSPANSVLAKEETGTRVVQTTPNKPVKQEEKATVTQDAKAKTDVLKEEEKTINREKDNTENINKLIKNAAVDTALANPKDSTTSPESTESSTNKPKTQERAATPAETTPEQVKAAVQDNVKGSIDVPAAYLEKAEGTGPFTAGVNQVIPYEFFAGDGMLTRLLLKASENAPWSDNGTAKNPALPPLEGLTKGKYFYEVDLNGNTVGKQGQDLIDQLKANGTQTYTATVKVYSDKDGKNLVATKNVNITINGLVPKETVQKAVQDNVKENIDVPASYLEKANVPGPFLAGVNQVIPYEAFGGDGMLTRLLLKSSENAPWSDNGTAKNPALLPLEGLTKGQYFYEVDLNGNTNGEEGQALLDQLRKNGTQTYQATVKVYGNKDGKADLSNVIATKNISVSLNGLIPAQKVNESVVNNIKAQTEVPASYLEKANVPGPFLAGVNQVIPYEAFGGDGMLTRLLLKSSENAPWSDNGVAKNPALLPLEGLTKGQYFYEVDLNGNTKGKEGQALLDQLRKNGTQTYQATVKVYGNKDGKADLSNVVATREVRITLHKESMASNNSSSTTNTTSVMKDEHARKEEISTPMMSHQKTTSQDMMKKDNMSTLPETGEIATNTAALGAFSAAFAFILGTLGLKAKKERN